MIPFLLLFFSANSEAGAEAVDSFVCEARLNSQGVMTVKESIEVDLDSSHRNSIYRMIPKEVNIPGRSHQFEVKVLSVTDGKGHSVGHAKVAHDGSISLKLDKHVHGRSGYYRYHIKYEVIGVCHFQDKHPTLVWNVVGRDWPMPVNKAEFVFYPPSGMKLTRTDVQAWKAGPDSKEKAVVRAIGNHAVATASNLSAGESLDIEIDFPAGTVKNRGFLDRAQWLLSEWYLLLALPLSTVVLLYLYRLARVRMNPPGNDGSDIWEPPS
ncbi:MAG: DUF2207 domain-containing protein, partial [Candidatus Obscuribacterales bacterium]|nr:DUF2207 domain-containing protein [Candidatus Obscuribacterales bacterium]